VRVPLTWSGTINEPPLEWRLAQATTELLRAIGLT